MTAIPTLATRTTFAIGDRVIVWASWTGTDARAWMVGQTGTITGFNRTTANVLLDNDSARRQLGRDTARIRYETLRPTNR